MTDPANPPPILIADHPALDFLNTVGAPHGTDIEWIGDGRSLIDWMVAAGILSESQAVTATTKLSAQDLNDAARQARELREWFRALVIRQDGGPGWQLTAEDREMVNTLMSAGTYRLRLLPGDTGSDGLRLSGGYEIETAEDILAPIAEQVSRLLADTECRLTRNCAGPNCTFWFTDITKNKKRRWCDMKLCGNRAKTAAFRERKKKG
ncbi:ABATE domain-containing protein [Roseibium sp. MMSF_3412]|uniref:CGNR zinc finger domain-containing protein n=1 Tax=Roseibium sp. MMSF_3412 TaxID=3046712 RepID=UPI00273F6173|nr:ABATE domain-containing protein [Roseibium sp. MMSF_3412]